MPCIHCIGFGTMQKLISTLIKHNKIFSGQTCMMQVLLRLAAIRKLIHCCLCMLIIQSRKADKES